MPSKTAILATVILLVIMFTGLDYFFMYQAAQNLKTDEIEILGLTPVKLPYVWKITLLINIENPSDYVFEVERIIYKVYINGTYVGEDARESIVIPAKSKSSQILTLEFDVRNLGEVALIVLSSNHIEVTVKGTIEVPVKLLRALPVTTVSLPYTYTKVLEIA